MPRASQASAPIEAEYGVASERTAHLDGYTVNFVSIHEDNDLAPMLKGLPDDACQCPHWGYVLSGQLTVRYTTARRSRSRQETPSTCRLGIRRVPRLERNSSSSALRPSSRRPRPRSAKTWRGSRPARALLQRRREQLVVREAPRRAQKSERAHVLEPVCER